MKRKRMIGQFSVTFFLYVLPWLNEQFFISMYDNQLFPVMVPFALTRLLSPPPMILSLPLMLVCLYTNLNWESTAIPIFPQTKTFLWQAMTAMSPLKEWIWTKTMDYDSIRGTHTHFSFRTYCDSLCLVFFLIKGDTSILVKLNHKYCRKRVAWTDIRQWWDGECAPFVRILNVSTVNYDLMFDCDSIWIRDRRANLDKLKLISSSWSYDLSLTSKCMRIDGQICDNYKIAGFDLRYESNRKRRSDNCIWDITCEH